MRQFNTQSFSRIRWMNFILGYYVNLPVYTGKKHLWLFEIHLNRLLILILLWCSYLYSVIDNLYFLFFFSPTKKKIKNVMLFQHQWIYIIRMLIDFYYYSLLYFLNNTIFFPHLLSKTFFRNNCRIVIVWTITKSISFF